jgi:hypothetical protein
LAWSDIKLVANPLAVVVALMTVAALPKPAAAISPEKRAVEMN